jgi:hypothetical protein
VAVEPQVSGYDRVYVVVERTINSVTTRYVEYLNDPYEGIRFDDYYTGVQATDETAYLAALYTAQKACVYLDGSLTYTGTATATITGLWHLEGQTVQVVADGRLHPDCVVSRGTITLVRTAVKVHVGFKYRGVIIPLNLVVVGRTQNSISFAKNVSTIALTVSNTIGVKYGTDMYEFQNILASEMGQLTDGPPEPYTGVLNLANEDTWSQDKRICYVQDDPYPCMLNAMNVTIDGGEK